VGQADAAIGPASPDAMAIGATVGQALDHGGQ